ncbi:MAG: CPBP family intramembrane metalloprotease [Clostridia bacterium]|nr:CPBP family intramembrane metalloprotease [Clostridia bacterium]
MKNKVFVISSLVVLFCIIMAIVDGVLKADYFAKSAIKLVLFLGFPAIYTLFNKEISLKPLFILKGKGILSAVLIGIGVYAVILGGYILLKDVFDFGNITGALTKNIGVNGTNFIYVSIYISFINSLLEEFFFRGFAFLTLKNISSRKFAYIFSAGVFALYHVAMMIGWFSAPVFIIVMAGLFAGGLIFNYFNEKSGTVYPSWLIHMCANFAINTVGFILFGII